MDLVRFGELKARVEESKKELAKAEGALSEQMRRLEKDFGCTTVGEAKEKLKVMTTERKSLKKRYDKLLEGFTAEWEDKL